MRIGDWTSTFTGRQFWPLDPRPEDVAIDDIAHALSNICRYGGHSKAFYSVAQHSVLVSRWITDLRLRDNGDTAKWGLLHDAAEAYVGDMVRPLKYQLPQYRSIERAVQGAIMLRFGLSIVEPPIVKKADDILLATEAKALMPPLAVAEWTLQQKPDPKVRIRPKGPKEACDEFMWMFHSLFGIGE